MCEAQRPKLILAGAKALAPDMLVNKSSHILPVLLMAMLFCSADSIIVGTNRNSLAALAQKVTPLLLASLLLVRMMLRGKRIPKPSVWAIALMACMMVNLLLYTNENSFASYIVQMTIVAVAVLVCCNFSFDEFSELFINTMVFLAVWSLAVFLLAIATPALVGNFPIISNANGGKYYVVGFAVVPELALRSIWGLRNYGIFREPGVYQFFLNLALIFSLFSSRKTDLRKFLILSITILTTTSTTGIIALAIVFISYLIKSKDQRKEKSVVIGIMMIVALVATVIILGKSQLLLYAVSKLGDAGNGSTISRLGSVRVNFEMWKEHPLFGVGSDVVNRQFSEYMFSIMNFRMKHNTNTVLFFFAAYGFFFGAIIVAGIWLLCNQISPQPMIKILIFIEMLVMLSGENFWYSFMPYILVIYGVCAAIPPSLLVSMPWAQARK